MTAPIPRDIPDLPAIPRTHALFPSYVSHVPAAAVVAPVRRPLAAVLRLLLAGAAVGSVGMAVALGDPLTVLSRFSVQSTLVLALVTALSARRAWTARRPLPGAVTGAALLYTVTGALAYHLLLAHNAQATPLTGGTGGWHAVASHLLHTAIPAAAVLDWLLLTPPARLRLRQAAVWLVYPLLYLGFTLARGHLLAAGSPGRYLYPFLDAAADGYRHTLANALLLGLAVYALSLLLTALDHTRPNPIRPHPKTGFRLQPPVG
ncbi:MULTISPECIES: Pr6Pr family membrane protein [unclassified Streptomyces]|uniref:Pr6Pr family membrane protein n=1 Tax=unclassified Streptomyces TaxID=2593676 RepID=UPI000DDA6F53|nr:MULTISPECIES: Pr6Pr family membrane protein [unclassified Streptomyces]QZZ29292.1 Pr6Pr family membrane protein [Streptomyces sp. ST1015]